RKVKAEDCHPPTEDRRAMYPGWWLCHETWPPATGIAVNHRAAKEQRQLLLPAGIQAMKSLSRSSQRSNPGKFVIRLTPVFRRQRLNYRSHRWQGQIAPATWTQGL